MADQSGNLDDVIDAQDDLEGRQGEEGNPDFRIGQPFPVYSFEQMLNRASCSAARLGGYDYRVLNSGKIPISKAANIMHRHTSTAHLRVKRW